MNQALETRDRIINFVKSKGPVLPFQIAKEINTNILMASAHLSELASSGILRISNIKVGGSPLYYAPGQENLLQKYASNLNEKEKRAYDLLSHEKILMDSELTPLLRVTLAEIKDFAKQATVNIDFVNHVVWKWYLTSNDEAKSILENNNKPLNISNQKSVQMEQIEIQKVIPQQAIQKSFAQEIINPEAPPQKTTKQDIKDELYSSLTSFFEKNKINVISFEIIKKNLEIDFILDIPSVFGSLTYYCKSKNKKRISDSDLSSAYLKGQFKKLPVLFLARGELSKKAAEILKNELKGMNFKKI